MPNVHINQLTENLADRVCDARIAEAFPCPAIEDACHTDVEEHKVPHVHAVDRRIGSGGGRGVNF